MCVFVCIDSGVSIWTFIFVFLSPSTAHTHTHTYLQINGFGLQFSSWSHLLSRERKCITASSSTLIIFFIWHTNLWPLFDESHISICKCTYSIYIWNHVSSIALCGLTQLWLWVYGFLFTTFWPPSAWD